MDWKRLHIACLSLLFAICLLFPMTGCSKVETDDHTGVLSSGETVEYYVPREVRNPGDRAVTLFIWNVDSWKTEQWYYRDELTVEKLLTGLAHVTNWDLTTAAVELKDQQCTIRWDRQSSLYAGFPDRQAKEYMVFEQTELDAAILDSVKKTILENLGLGYSVFYADDTGGDLKLPGVSAVIPADSMYTRFWDYLPKE